MRREMYLRSLIKAITYRIVTSAVYFVGMLCLTGSMTLASAASLIDVAWRMIVYYLHERLWDMIGWGIVSAGRSSAQTHLWCDGRNVRSHTNSSESHVSKPRTPARQT